MANPNQSPIPVYLSEAIPSTNPGIPIYADYQSSSTSVSGTNVYTDVQESTFYSTVRTQPIPPVVPTPPLPQPTSYPVLQNVAASATYSIFPMMEQPFGPIISVYVEDNSHHQKRNRRLVGAGVAAAACAATGGLIVIPALAGFALNKVVKSNREKCVYAYANTFIYELRAALANGLGVPPELLQIKRKGVYFDDCARLSTYLEYPGKQRIHVAIHVKDRPVVGSVCQYEGQYAYPPVQYVDCSSYQFVV